MNTQVVKEELSREEGREVAVFQKPRLPYHQGLKDRFGIEPSGWKALVEVVFPSARSVDAVVMALSYCKARNLDVFKRPVHVVPMWDSKKGGYVETIWPGISELRTTAFRTGNYAGSDEAEFGPIIERTFKGRVKKGQDWETKEIDLQFPEWCRVTVYRDLHGRLCKFVGPKVVWLEAYATIGRSDLPNDMWQSRPEGQIEKCAEAAALRKAFPEELGNELTAEEMAGRMVSDDNARDRVAASSSPGPDEAPPDHSTVKGGNGSKQSAPKQEAKEATKAKSEPDEIVVEVEEEALPLEEPALEAKANATEQSKVVDGFTADERQWLKDVEGAFSSCEDMVSLGVKQKEVMAPRKKDVSAQAWIKAQFLVEDHFKRIQKANEG